MAEVNINETVAFFDEKRMREAPLNWPFDVVQALKHENLRTIAGDGNPTGIVASNLSRLYVDEAGDELYFSTALGSKIHWVVL